MKKKPSKPDKPEKPVSVLLPDGGKPCVKDLSLEELTAWLTGKNHPAYRAAQVWEWLHARGAENFDAMTNVPKPLRADLDAAFTTNAVTVEKTQVSSDGSIKLIFRLQDGERIESVLMPEPNRITLCVSTQAGCSMGCVFCLTGAGGLRRKLTASEIIDQVLAARRHAPQGRRLTHLVFMGMGEPLANFDNFRRSLETLTHPRGAAFTPRHITFSTVGLANRIKRAAKELPPVNMAVSLNAADNILRSHLMPVNRKFALDELLAACRVYAKVTQRPVTFEYVMLYGINDAVRHARNLVELTQNIPCKINLIPYNPHPGATFQPPPDHLVADFQAELKKHGRDVFIRQSRGSDIGAACGQLGGVPDAQKKKRNN